MQAKNTEKRNQRNTQDSAPTSRAQRIFVLIISFLLATAVCIGTWKVSNITVRNGLPTQSVQIEDKSDFLDKAKTEAAVNKVIWGSTVNVLVLIQPVREFDEWQHCAIRADFKSCIHKQYPIYFAPSAYEELRDNAIIVWIDPDNLSSGLYYPNKFRNEANKDLGGIENLILWALLKGKSPESAIANSLQILADMHSNVAQSSPIAHIFISAFSALITFTLVYLAANATLQVRWWKANAGAVGAMNRRKRRKLLAAIHQVYTRSSALAKDQAIHSDTYTQFARGIFATSGANDDDLTKPRRSRELSALAQLAWETLNEFQSEISFTDIRNLELIQQAYQNPAPAISTADNLGILPESALDPHHSESNPEQDCTEEAADTSRAAAEKQKQRRQKKESRSRDKHTKHNGLRISPSVVLLSSLIAIAVGINTVISEKQDFAAQTQHKSSIIATQPDLADITTDKTFTPLIEKRDAAPAKKVTALNFYDHANLFSKEAEKKLRESIVGMPYAVDSEVFVITTNNKFALNQGYVTNVRFNEVLMEEYPELYVRKTEDRGEYIGENLESLYYEFRTEHPTIIVFADGGKQRFIDYITALPDSDVEKDDLFVTSRYYSDLWNPQDVVGDDSGVPATPETSPTTTVWNAVATTSNLARHVDFYEAEKIELVRGSDTANSALRATGFTFLIVLTALILCSIPLRRYFQKRAEDAEIRSTLTVLTLTADSLLLEGIRLDQIAPEARPGEKINNWYERFTKLQPRLSDDTLAAEAGYSRQERLTEVRNFRDEAAQLWTLEAQINSSNSGIGNQLLYITARRIEHAPRVQSYFWFDKWVRRLFRKMYRLITSILERFFYFLFNRNDGIFKRICKFALVFFGFITVYGIASSASYLRIPADYHPDVLISDVGNLFTDKERKEIAERAQNQEFATPGQILIYTMPNGEECKFESNREINPEKRGLSDKWSFTWTDWEDANHKRSYLAPHTIGVCVSENSLVLNGGFYNVQVNDYFEKNFSEASGKSLARKLLNSLRDVDLASLELYISDDISRQISDSRYFAFHSF